MVLKRIFLLLSTNLSLTVSLKDFYNHIMSETWQPLLNIHIMIEATFECCHQLELENGKLTQSIIEIFCDNNDHHTNYRLVLNTLK